MSDWYIDDAMKLLEKAKNKKGLARRRQVAVAIRQLVSYLAKRSAPRRSAVSDCDEAVCDKCFRKMPRRGLDAELCLECENKRGRNRGKKKIDAMVEDNPERIASLEEHEERVRAELTRLKFHGDEAPN